MIVRAARPDDVAAIQAIYAHHVLDGTGTFEEAPPSPAEMAERMAAVTGRGLPWLVAEIEGQVAGYAYAGPFRLRAAYRYTAEDTVYVSPRFQRRGVGLAVLSGVVGACEALGLHQLVAVIGGSDNTGSIRLHAALGFEHVGVTPGLGWKKDRWCDVVWMQKALNGGVSLPPVASGIDL